MKALFILKTVVFLLTALLFAGFAFMFTKVADKQAQSKLKKETQSIPLTLEFESEQALSETESIVSMINCDNLVCLLVQGDKKGPRLLVIQPKTGKMIHSIWLKQLPSQVSAID